MNPQDEQQKYYETMNRRLANQEAGDKLFRQGCGLYCGILLGLLGIIIAALAIGAIWVAIFGPSQPPSP